MSPEHQSLLHVSCLCVASFSVGSWLALQFALQDLKTALIALLQVYTHCLYGASYGIPQACVCVCVCGFLVTSRRVCVGCCPFVTYIVCLVKGVES